MFEKDTASGVHRALERGVSLGKKDCQEKSQKVHSGVSPLCYLISAGRHQLDLTIASGIRTRRWRSHQTIGGSSRICVCQTLTARPPQTLLGKHLLSRCLDPTWVYLVGKAVLAGGVTGLVTELSGRRHLVRNLPEPPTLATPSSDEPYTRSQSSLMLPGGTTRLDCDQVDG